MMALLIRLQSGGIDDPRLVRTLRVIVQRVDALASVHRTLHRASELAR